MSLPDPVFDHDEAVERGFYGFEVDPTPNENYSLQTPPDAPTPETDASAKAAARERREDIRARLTGREDEKSAEGQKTAPASKSSSKTSSASS